MGKRAFDWLVSSALLLGLWPLMLVIAVAVWLDSPGPALFRQQRVGRHGRLFWIHKFRTMRAAPEQGRVLQVTGADDARITRVGRFLRRSKLDELPQLFDVWRGAMSLVGPRPEVPRFMAAYAAPVRERILSVRPGLTDWATVVFRDEERLLAQTADPERTYVETVLPVKQRYYLAYVAEHSFIGDLRILWATACAVAGRRVTVPEPVAQIHPGSDRS